MVATLRLDNADRANGSLEFSGFRQDDDGKVLRTPVSTPSLRAQRSNPGCHLGGTLDCFVTLAMTMEKPLPRRARDLGLLWRRHFGRRDQPLQLGDAGAAIGARLELCADLGGGAGTGDDGLADGAAA